MVVHAHGPSAPEVEAEGSNIQSQKGHRRTKYGEKTRAAKTWEEKWVGT